MPHSQNTIGTICVPWYRLPHRPRHLHRIARVAVQVSGTSGKAGVAQGSVETTYIGKPMKPYLIAPADLAPDFELEDINGNPIRLSSFRGGKPVLLAFLRGFM